MKPDMLFNLGSITKQFTAVAILQLMEAGKISLQDTVQKYISDFPSKSHKITIEHLLTHTSGLKDYLQIDYKIPFLERRDFKPQELLEYFKSEALEFEPGTRYKYSNSGYFLLGYLIETVTGKTYENYLKENIFNKLSLTNTYYDSPNTVLPNRTYGYKSKNEKADYWGATIPYAAGGLISSTSDLLSWHNGLLAGKLIKKETLTKAFTPYTLKNGIEVNYGYGWMINSSAISHGGAITGYRTNEVYYPVQGIYIAILANCDCAPIEELSVSISSTLMGRSLQMDLKQPENVLDRYIGIYKLTSDPKRQIKIVKEKGVLIAYFSDNQSYPLVFQSDRKFEFKNILDAKCEFIDQNGTVGFTVHQNGVYNWQKI